MLWLAGYIVCACECVCEYGFNEFCRGKDRSLIHALCVSSCRSVRERAKWQGNFVLVLVTSPDMSIYSLRIAHDWSCLVFCRHCGDTVVTSGLSEKCTY